MFHYLNFLSEQTTFIPVTEPARLPDSNGESLNTSKREKTMSLILFLIYPKKEKTPVSVAQREAKQFGDGLSF